MAKMTQETAKKAYEAMRKVRNQPGVPAWDDQAEQIQEEWIAMVNMVEDKPKTPHRRALENQLRARLITSLGVDKNAVNALLQGDLQQVLDDYEKDFSTVTLRANDKVLKVMEKLTVADLTTHLEGHPMSRRQPEGGAFAIWKFSLGGGAQLVVGEAAIPCDAIFQALQIAKNQPYRREQHQAIDEALAMLEAS